VGDEQAAPEGPAAAAANTVTNSGGGGGVDGLGCEDVELCLRERSLDVRQATRDPADFDFDEIEHLRLFYQREQDWRGLGRCALLLGSLGFSQLLQAYGYFSTAKFYIGSDWASCIIQFVVTLVDAIFAHVYLMRPHRARILAAMLNICGPAAGMFALRIHDPLWIDTFCIPLCFGCHLLWGCIAFWMVRQTVLANVASDAADEAFAKHLTGLGCHDMPPDDECGAQALQQGSASPRDAAGRLAGVGTLSPGASTSDRAPRPRQSFCLVYIACLAVILVWGCSLGWSLRAGSPDDGLVMATAASRHVVSKGASAPERGLARVTDSRSGFRSRWRARSRSGHRSAPRRRDPATATATSREIRVTWPSLRFRPHAIACSSSSSGGVAHCFVANEYRIYRMNAGLDDNSTLVQVPCAVHDPIVGLNAVCGSGVQAASAGAGGGRCRLLAVVRGRGGPGAAAARAVECGRRTAEEHALLPLQVDEQLIAFQNSSRLLSVQGGQLLQHALAARGGWSLQRAVKLHLSGDLVAISAAVEGRYVVLFHRSGCIDLVDILSGETCARAVAPSSVHGKLVDSAVMLQDSALLLVHAASGVRGRASGATSLVQVSMQTLVAACGV